MNSNLCVSPRISVPIRASKMAKRSDSEIARLLNINPADSDAFFDVINDYFVPRIDEESSDVEESDAGKLF